MRPEGSLGARLNRALREDRGQAREQVREDAEPEVDARTAEREARGVPRGEPAGNVDAGAGRNPAPVPESLAARINAALRG